MKTVQQRIFQTERIFNKNIEGGFQAPKKQSTRLTVKNYLSISDSKPVMDIL